MSALVTGRLYRFWRLLFMAILMGVTGFITLHIVPHFEDHFAMYKMFVYETNTGLTKNFHYMNDIMGWETWLGKLQLWFPSVSWWSVAVLATVVISTVAITWMLGGIAAKRQLPLPIWSMLITLLLIFFSWNIFWVHHNRAAFVLAALGLIGSIIQPLQCGWLASVKRMFWAALFALGICWRMEAGMVTLFLIAPLVWLTEGSSLKHVWHKLGLPLVVALVFMSIYMVKTNYNPDFYYAIEPEAEYELMNRRNIIPIAAMQSAKDSMRYRAVNEYWMLGDIQQTNAAFIRSLIPKPAGFYHRFFFFLKPGNAPDRNLPVTELMLTYAILLLNYGVLLWLIWLQRSKRVAMFMFAYITFSLLLLALSFSIEHLQRVIQPFLLLLSMSMFFIAVIRYRPIKTPAVLLLATLVTALNTYYLVKEITTMQIVSTDMLKTEARIRDQIKKYVDASGRPYLLPFMDFSIFNTGVFTPYNGFKDKRLLFYEFGQFSGSPPLLQTITNITGCPADDFKCRLDFLQQHRHEFILIATPQRLTLLEEYARVMYGLDIALSQSHKEHLNDNNYLWFP